MALGCCAEMHGWMTCKCRACKLRRSALTAQESVVALGLARESGLRDGAEKIRRAFLDGAPCRCGLRGDGHREGCAAIAVARVSEGINTDKVLGLTGAKGEDDG